MAVPPQKTPATLPQEIIPAEPPSSQPFIPQVAQGQPLPTLSKPSAFSQRTVSETEKRFSVDLHIETTKLPGSTEHNTTVQPGPAREFGNTSDAMHKTSTTNDAIPKTRVQSVMSSVDEVVAIQQGVPLLPQSMQSIVPAIPLTVVPTTPASWAREAGSVAPQITSYQQRESAIPLGEHVLEKQEAQPSRQEAPTIQVSIGRIEVRATAPEPRPQPPRSEPRITGLDEYLSQRANGGGR